MGKVFTYFLYEELYSSYSSTLIELAKELGAEAVAELGGGARPLLTDDAAWSFVPTRVVYDIEAKEFEKASDQLIKRQADLCQPLEDEGERFDLVFSKMLCEHLLDPEVFHRNCFHLLRPGGLSVHFFPTLYASPFVLNRIIPELAARRLIRLLQPHRLDNPKTRKFPAYYRWCHGPTSRAIKRYQALGFQIEEWRTGFGHDYYKRFAPLQSLENAKSQILVGHPVRWLSAYAMVILRKPR
jgi:SAM-dependent methyltransferase